MLVSGFMVPAEKVATCYPSDTLRTALDTMLTNKVGSIVVLMPETQAGEAHVPVGILTKTDLVKAYRKEMPLSMAVREVMSKGDLLTVRDNESRDQAARLFERSKMHHAVVVGKDKQFLGIISAWDIVRECVRDDRAWPWIRSEDGKFHMPNETKKSPRSTAVESPPSPSRGGGVRDSHAFMDYIDSVREMPYMDD